LVCDILMTKAGVQAGEIRSLVVKLTIQHEVK